MIARLIIAVLLLLPVPAMAQSETGTRLGGRPAQLPESGTNAERARVWLERFADCIARRDSGRVAKILSSSFVDDPAVSQVLQVSYDDCLAGSIQRETSTLTLNDRLLRGALYANYVTRHVERLSSDMLPAQGLVFPDLAQLQADKVERVALVRLGECVVRQDPANTLAFVRADAAGDREDAALNAIAPRISPCINAGSTVKISRSVLEAALAEAIYRLTTGREAAE